jgi:O-antigen ligase
MVISSYKSSSRGPWLALIVSLALLFILDCRTRIPHIIVVGLVVLVLVVRPGIGDTLKTIYLNSLDTNTSEGSSFEYRSALKTVAAHALSRSPDRALWGYGLESFYALHLEGEFLGKPHAFLSCDNAWIEFMVETGYVGLAIMILLLGTPLVIAVRNSIGQPGSDTYLSRTLLIIITAYLMMMLGVGMYAWGQTGYMLWIMIALVIAHDRLLRRSQHNHKAKLRALAASGRETGKDLISVAGTYCTSAVKPWGGAGGCGEPNW